LFLFRVWGTKDYCKAGFPTEKSSYKVIWSSWLIWTGNIAVLVSNPIITFGAYMVFFLVPSLVTVKLPVGHPDLRSSLEFLPSVLTVVILSTLMRFVSLQRIQSKKANLWPGFRSSLVALIGFGYPFSVWLPFWIAKCCFNLAPLLRFYPLRCWSLLKSRIAHHYACPFYRCYDSRDLILQQSTVSSDTVPFMGLCGLEGFLSIPCMPFARHSLMRFVLKTEIFKMALQSFSYNG
jgi:hypothetical protein